MKTDREVLEGAIKLLEREDGWCQGVLYKEGMGKLCPFERISHCAEGAIRESAGLIGVRAIVMATGQVNETFIAISKQCNRIDNLVLDNCEDPGARISRIYRSSLFEINDHPNTTAADMILAMKKAMEELP